MKYAIVYSSKTGNTRLLAERIQAQLPQGDCVYCGAPAPEALTAERIYLGFWTDKGTCDARILAFLPQLTSQEVFLFGTAGFGGARSYFDQILGRVKGQLPQGVRLVGSFMCQGKMPMAVRERYEAMEESPRRQMMLENFDRALPHPDAADLEQLKAALSACL